VIDADRFMVLAMETRPSWKRRLFGSLLLVALATAMNFGTWRLLELTPDFPFQVGLAWELVGSFVVAIVGMVFVLAMFARLLVTETAAADSR
jgi:hypothetical protein